MAKDLALINYKDTKEDSNFLDPIKPETWYQISEKDKKTLTNVMKRFQDMKSARNRIDIDWKIWQQIIEWKYYPYSDWRTRVNVPVFRALVELFVSEATSRKIDKKIEPLGLSDVDKVEIMNEVWDWEWNKNKRDEQMTDAEYKCAWFWTCAYFTWFEQTSRIINDVNVDDSWEISFIKKLMQQGRIILKTLDIRNVYFDDRVTSFNDANDEIYIEYLTQEQFEAEKDNKYLQNTEYVWVMWKTDQVYFTWEDMRKQNTKLIEKLHYWNKQADRYIIIYNRNIVWRDTPIPYSHKELPIVPRQYGYISDSIYWRWLAEACMQFLSKINKLSEMLFDWIARSNNSIFALWNGLTFDWWKFSFNNQIIKFNWQLNDSNFREIKGIPPNQPAFTYLQDLLKEIAIYVWIDISQIVWQASSTAFETAIRTESSLKRVNVVLINRDYALQKVFERHLANIMQFFPISEAQRLCEINPKWDVTQNKEKLQYPKILMEWKNFIPETWKLVEQPWKFEFECKPEYIRGQMDIYVKTNFNSPTLKAMKQDNMNKFLTDLWLYTQMSMQNPDLAKILKPDDYIKQLAFTYDVDINSIWWFSDSISKQADELMKIVQQMSWVAQDNWPLAWIWQPWWMQTPTPAPQWQQPNPMLPNVESKGLPPVRSPELPWINNLSPAQKIWM